jgi:nitrile hydratase
MAPPSEAPLPDHHSHDIEAIHRELHSHLPSEPALRVKALESLLVEKGMLDPATVDAWIEVYSEEIGPKRGAEVVARAWSDAEYQERLLANGSAAIAELGFEGGTTGHLRVVANTPTLHNLVVCTLCSCYPHSLLGIPPNWYKTAAYRSRAVRDPRGVLRDFGVDLADEVQVRVWDSTAELRYMVLPERPPGTEGWSERQLAAIVTRNAMIGTQRDLRFRARSAG